MNEFDSLFSREPAEAFATNETKPWKILIVDDEKDIHAITMLALEDFQFLDRHIEFIQAYSATEALVLLRKNPDIALVFLDMVMEEEDAGLTVVQYIRDSLQNREIRIIMRTGHPGLAPEKTIIADYDINDYRVKTEFTIQKLFSMTMSALRSFQLIRQLGVSQKSLRRLNEMRERQSQEILGNKIYLDAIFRTVVHMAIIATDKTGVVRYYNTAARVLFSQSADKVIGNPLQDFLEWTELFAQDYEHLLQKLEHKKDVCHQTDYQGPDGEVPLDLRLTKILDETGEEIGLVLSGRDRSHERRTSPKKRTLDPSPATAVSQATVPLIKIPGFLSCDNKLQEIFQLIQDLQDCSAPVLVQGESGTGKELVATSIHTFSNRKNNIFLPVNCGAVPEDLLESALFGHEKGAFTGAVRTQKGLFEQADKGTIFLDEIGEISQSMQVKLLRVLQQGTLQRIGGEKTITVDVRVVAATNKDLKHEMAVGNFREDLYYRICVVPIELPPLRKRKKDIQLLSDFFLKKVKKEDGVQRALRISPEAAAQLLRYNWPGNIRELHNAIRLAVVLCKGGTIQPAHLPASIKDNQTAPDSSGILVNKREKLDLDSVIKALRTTNNNRKEAASLLGVGRATLYRFLAKHENLF